jgi:hypothetical protein
MNIQNKRYLSTFVDALLRVSVFILLTSFYGCIVQTTDSSGQCKTSAMNSLLKKETRILLQQNAFDPAHFEAEVKSCVQDQSLVCSCDITIEGKVCNEDDRQDLLTIMNSLTSIKISRIHSGKLKVAAPQTLEFFKSPQFGSAEKSASSSDSLHLGYVKTPLGQIDIYAYAQLGGRIAPAVVINGVTLKLVPAQQRARACYEFYSNLPLNEAYPDTEACALIIDGLENDDSLYLLCGQQWSLIGTWGATFSHEPDLPSHLKGF